jgi:hypothetical protein
VLTPNGPKIYFVKDGERHGPFDAAQIKRFFESRVIDGETLVWFEAVESWTELKRIESLYSLCRNVGQAGPPSRSSSTETSDQSDHCYLVSHWKGHLSPAKAFWISTVLPVSLYALIVANLGPITDAIGRNFSAGAVWVFYLSILTSFGCLFIWQSVGLWRVSDNQTNSSTTNAAIRAFLIFYLIAVAPNFVYFASNISPVEKESFSPRQYSVSTSGRAIFIKGPLEYGIAHEFSQQLSANPHLDLVVLDSGGGLTSEANKLSRKIEESGLSTVVLNKCLSACTRVFASGAERILLHKSNIGFHSTKGFLNIKDINEEQTLEFYKPLVDMGFPEDMLLEIAKTSPESMWYAPTMPLYESGFITQIAPNLDSLGSDSDRSGSAKAVPIARQSTDDFRVITFSNGKLKLPVLDGLLAFGAGDYVYEVFDSMTYGENELVMVLVREQDYNVDGTDESGYRLYGRVEVLMPQMKVNDSTFRGVKRLFAEKYEVLISQAEENLQAELEKGSQRLSQTTESDVRITGTEIRPIKLVENNEDFLLYEFSLASEVYRNGTSRRVHQSGLQSLMNLNNSVIMANWYSDQESPELRSEMYDLAYKFVRSSMAVNQ